MSSNYSSSPFGHPIVDECRRLRRSIEHIARKYRGSALDDDDNTRYPMVLLLGNHSSGKSSFINYLVKRRVQSTGVAPTDDNFTIIGPSEGGDDVDRNGPALVGDPDLGFSGLKVFGSVLVNHTQLKLRSGLAIRNFMIVDSPGMIDSPVTADQLSLHSAGLSRGYDFAGVCRWYADRADVILLFFDPDKPGTTGETLSILTTALVGLDHKLYIILNKADQFEKIHDFARAYGSLCWNLSKVIPRKDLPRIHTMCVPVNSPSLLSDKGVNSPSLWSDRGRMYVQKSTDSLVGDDATTLLHLLPGSSSPYPPRSFFEQGVQDLQEARAEVLREAMNAPLRRIDNEISRLTDYVSALSMYCSLLDRVLAQYRDQLWTGRCRVLLAVGLGTVATAAAGFLCDRLFPDSTTGAASIKSHSHIGSIAGQGAPLISPSSSGKSSLLSEFLRPKQLVVMVTAGVGVVGTAAVYLWQRACLYGTMKQLRSRPYVESLLGQLFSKPTAIRDDESVSTMSRHVLDQFCSSVDDVLIQSSDRVQSIEFAALKRILGEDIPHLRRQATPSQPVIVHRSCLDEDCFLSNTTEPDMKTDSSRDDGPASTGDHDDDSPASTGDHDDDGPASTGDHDDDGPASTGDHHCSDSKSADDTSAGSLVPIIV